MSRGFWRRWTATWVATCLWMMGLPIAPALAMEPPPQEAAAAPAAEARGARAAILPLVVDGELSEADTEQLSAELVEGLQRGDFGVVGPDEVLKRSPGAEDCAKERCLESIAADTGASHVVRARVTVQDRDYDVFVELFDGSSGASLAKTEEGCEICGVADAGNLVASAAATLRTKLDALAKGPSTLTISSDPAGAEVRLDGDIIGVTPLERPVIAGKRVVRVTKEGFIAVEREVTFVEGVSEKVSFELEKVPSRLPSRPWGWVSLGVGVASLGAAIAFGVLGATEAEYKFRGDSNRNGCFRDVDDDGNCKYVWNTEWHALGFGIAGGALTTLGIAVLLNSRARKKASRESAPGRAKGKREASRRRRPRLGLGLGNVTLHGRF